MTDYLEATELHCPWSNENIFFFETLTSQYDFFRNINKADVGFADAKKRSRYCVLSENEDKVLLQPEFIRLRLRFLISPSVWDLSGSLFSDKD